MRGSLGVSGGVSLLRGGILGVAERHLHVQPALPAEDGDGDGTSPARCAVERRSERSCGLSIARLSIADDQVPAEHDGRVALVEPLRLPPRVARPLPRRRRAAGCARSGCRSPPAARSARRYPGRWQGHNVERGPPDPAVLGEVVEHSLRGVDRDRKADAGGLIEPFEAMRVVMPMTSPRELSSGPPELPGLMAASVWMASSMGCPLRADGADGGDDAAGERAAEPERVADGIDPLADDEAVGFGQAWRVRGWGR